MNNLKSFYDTLNKDIPFNELSVESMDILEQSDAYKRYCKRLKRLENYLYVESIALSLIGTLAIGILLLNEALKQM